MRGEGAPFPGFLALVLLLAPACVIPVAQVRVGQATSNDRQGTATDNNGTNAYGPAARN